MNEQDLHNQEEWNNAHNFELERPLSRESTLDASRRQKSLLVVLNVQKTISHNWRQPRKLFI